MSNGWQLLKETCEDEVADLAAEIKQAEISLGCTRACIQVYADAGESTRQPMALEIP